MFCSRCGVQVVEGNRFCQACGQEVGAAVAAASVRPLARSPSADCAVTAPVSAPLPYAGFWERFAAY